MQLKRDIAVLLGGQIVPFSFQEGESLQDFFSGLSWEDHFVDKS
jgi:hypothetical protein